MFGLLTDEFTAFTKTENTEKQNKTTTKIYK